MTRRTITVSALWRALVMGVLILSHPSGLALAASFDVNLQLSGRDILDTSSAFNRVASTTGPGANAGINDTWSITFDSVGANAFGGGIVTGTTAGFARPGLLGAAPVIHGATFGDGQAAGVISARAASAFAFDVTFGCSLSVCPSTVSGKLPMPLHGAYFVDAPFGPPNVGTTHAEIRLQVLGVLGGNVPLGQGELRASRTMTSNGVGIPDLTIGGAANGLLSGYTGGTTVLPFSFTNAPVGVPVSFGISMLTEASGTLSHFGAFASLADASADFFNTLSLRPTSEGTVFDLPAGFTANSTDANIVDNRWNPQATPVPEPASGWLVALGVLALAWRCRAATIKKP